MIVENLLKKAKVVVEDILSEFKTCTPSATVLDDTRHKLEKYLPMSVCDSDATSVFGEIATKNCPNAAVARQLLAIPALAPRAREPFQRVEQL